MSLQLVEETTDVGEPIVVIGAGSTGSSIAFHLSVAGRKVVLVDRGEIASGMTSRSTALVRTHYSNELVAKMALYSLRYFKSRSNDTGFVQNGMVVIAGESSKSGIQENALMLERVGVRNESLDKAQAKKMFPEVNFDDMCDYVLYEPESGYADPVATAAFYARMARELGATVLTSVAVNRIESANGNVTSVRLSDGRSIKASKIVIATNVWTNKLLEMSGVRSENLLPLWAAAHPVIVYKRPESYQGKAKVIVADLYQKTYYKPEGRSLLFAGSLDSELDLQRTDPDSPQSEIPFEFVTSASEAISRRIPDMRDGTMHSSYIGMYDMTPDQHPIVDELSHVGLGGAYVCVGLSGHGFKLCPALGLMCAEMVMEKPSSLFDWKRFSLSRFARGETFMSKYAGVGTIA